MRLSKDSLFFLSQTLFIYVEKRSLPLEASKALVNFYNGKISKSIADSLIDRLKKHLDLWIEDPSIVQIYKRYFNYLKKTSSLLLSECFSPFVLVNCKQAFEELIEKSKEKGASEKIKEFFRKIPVEEALKEREPESCFRKILSGVPFLPHELSLYITTHIAYMINPNIFVPITPQAGKYLCIVDEYTYMAFLKKQKEKKIRPMDIMALLNLLFEISPSRVKVIEELLDLDRKRMLLSIAERLWKEGKYYEVHEVLEDVWCMEKDKEKREMYQALVRLAIAMHHLKSGERDKAIRVYKKAKAQIDRVRVDLDVNMYLKELEEALSVSD